MPIVVPDYLLTEKGHISTIVVCGQTQTLSTAGNTLADDSGGTPGVVTLTGRIKALNVEITPEKSEIRPITSPRHNNVVLADAVAVSIDVLKVNAATYIDALRKLVKGYDYFRVSWVEGTLAGSIETMTFYGSRGQYQSSASGGGPIIASVSFDCIDVGQTDFFKIAVS